MAASTPVESQGRALAESRGRALMTGGPQIMLASLNNLGLRQYTPGVSTQYYGVYGDPPNQILNPVGIPSVAPNLSRPYLWRQRMTPWLQQSFPVVLGHIVIVFVHTGPGNALFLDELWDFGPTACDFTAYTAHTLSPGLPFRYQGFCAIASANPVIPETWPGHNPIYDPYIADVSVQGANCTILPQTDQAPGLLSLHERLDAQNLEVHYQAVTVPPDAIPYQNPPRVGVDAVGDKAVIFWFRLKRESQLPTQPFKPADHNLFVISD